MNASDQDERRGGQKGTEEGPGAERAEESGSGLRVRSLSSAWRLHRFLLPAACRNGRPLTIILASGEKYLEELDYENAEASYLKAIEIDPKQERPYVALAQMYMDQGEVQKAKDILEQGEEKCSGGEPGRRQRGG